MLNNFIYAQEKDLFLEQLNAGNILDEAIVFIEDTKEIWNHGHYFGGGDNEQVANIISQISQITTTLDTKATKSELSDYAKTSAIPTKVSQLTNDSNYLTQTQADGLYIALSQLESINNSISQLSTTVDGIATHFSTGKFSIDGYVSEKMITRTSISAIPITAGSCKCTISSNATFTFAGIPEAGRNIYVLIYNSGSSTVTVTLPNTGWYKSFSGTSLTIPASGYAEISAFSDGTTIFLRAGM